MTDAFILAGGLGTRLRSVMPDDPKVLAPAAGRPMLAHLLDQLAEAGFSRVVLGTGYLADKIEVAFGPSFRGMELIYSRESAPLGTGGALRHAARHFRGGDVLVLNGDSYVAVHLPTFLAWHRARRADVSILLTAVSDPGRYGAVEIGAGGRITAFHEKSARVSGRAWINAGVYVASRAAVEGIAADRSVSLEREVLADERLALYGYPGGGAFLDIGVPESLARAEEFFRGGLRTAPVRTPVAVLLELEGSILTGGDVGRPDEVRLLPGALPGLRRMRALGLKLAVVVRARQARLLEAVRGACISFDGVFSCPHEADPACDCWPPALGLVRRAATTLGIDPGETVVVGATAFHIAMGRALGVPTILLSDGSAVDAARADVIPDFRVDSLEAAADVIPHIPLALHQSEVGGPPGPSWIADEDGRMS
jgi:dTDP-glucose pyrophosphorylase/histidinol phosphatase-like enzyme